MPINTATEGNKKKTPKEMYKSWPCRWFFFSKPWSIWVSMIAIYRCLSPSSNMQIENFISTRFVFFFLKFCLLKRYFFHIEMNSSTFRFITFYISWRISTGDKSQQRNVVDNKNHMYCSLLCQNLSNKWLQTSKSEIKKAWINVNRSLYKNCIFIFIIEAHKFAPPAPI